MEARREEGRWGIAWGWRELVDWRQLERRKMGKHGGLEGAASKEADGRREMVGRRWERGRDEAENQRGTGLRKEKRW